MATGCTPGRTARQAQKVGQVWPTSLRTYTALARTEWLALQLATHPFRPRVARQRPYNRPPLCTGGATNPLRPELSSLLPSPVEDGGGGLSPFMRADTGVVGCKAAALQGLAPVGRIPRVKRRRGLPSAHPAGRGVWESVTSVCAHKARAPVPKEAQGGWP